MSTRLSILASLFVLTALIPCADAKITAEAAFAMLHEVSSEGVEVKEPKTKATEPKVIVSEKELAAAIKDDKVLARLKKEVDFSKGKLLFFAWAGSGQDRLSSGLGRSEKGRDAVFTYTPGRTRDYVTHVKLFFVGKDVDWRVKQGADE